jgi:AAA+ ATPase superfamily predicted ATPase
MHRVGRENEYKIFQKLYASNKSEFIAVFGRRRVGKTYLIRSFLNEYNCSFQVTGLSNASLAQQLFNFSNSLSKHTKQQVLANNWLHAFQLLINYLENSTDKKKVVFIDELPWFDTSKSNFIQALEHFWNSWASTRKDVMLIVCGSAASWMIHKLINNTGGLHNRVTKKIKISPFTLAECEAFLKMKNIPLDRYQIVQLYMVLGGIPFYWDEVEVGKSAAQNIEQICFSENGLLKTEFNNLYQSLFKNSVKHLIVVNQLAKKAKGLTREEILNNTSLPNGGSSTRILEELEESGFIRKYVPFGKNKRESLYQLSDFYTLFYFNFIQNSNLNDKNNWLNTIDGPKQRAWSGYAYEQVCLYHINQIKNALGISGIETFTSAWRSKTSAVGAQIDLVIDRRDRVINLCEMKFSINEFAIDKKYDADLRNKIGTFKTETKTKKSVFLTMVTTFGLQQNAYAGLVQNSITLNDLFNG